MEINQSEDRFVIFDAEKMRKFGILNLGGTPVYGADEKYIFYYDELIAIIIYDSLRYSLLILIEFFHNIFILRPNK